MKDLFQTKRNNQRLWISDHLTGRGPVQQMKTNSITTLINHPQFTLSSWWFIPGIDPTVPEFRRSSFLVMLACNWLLDRSCCDTASWQEAQVESALSRESCETKRKLQTEPYGKPSNQPPGYTSSKQSLKISFGQASSQFKLVVGGGWWSLPAMIRSCSSTTKQGPHNYEKE